MQFKHIKLLAERLAEDKVSDCLITFPNFYGYMERKSILQSAKIAGFNILAILNDNVGASIDYGWDKISINKKIIIYNMGSSSTQVTLVNYSRLSEKSNSNNQTEYNQISIASEAYAEVGGRDFDINMVNHLKKIFLEQSPERRDKLRSNSNGFNEKLLQSSIKLKEVLSANKEGRIEIIGGDDLNFYPRITRETFETINVNILKNITHPIDQLLKRNNLAIANIDQIEIIGGSTRIPRVQELLREKYGNDKIGLHLNSDESVAMGGAYLGSKYTDKLRTKKFEINHGLSFEFHIKLQNESQDKKCERNSCPKKLNKDIPLFKIREGFNISKTISLAYFSDFKVLVFEKSEDHSKEHHFITYLVKVTDKISSEKFNQSNSKVFLKFNLDHRGLLHFKVN